MYDVWFLFFNSVFRMLEGVCVLQVYQKVSSWEIRLHFVAKAPYPHVVATCHLDRKECFIW